MCFKNYETFTTYIEQKSCFKVLRSSSIDNTILLIVFSLLLVN